jgi:homogentisate phytyltransferase/homogentisate geranylgeranyltransferase
MKASLQSLVILSFHFVFGFAYIRGTINQNSANIRNNDRRPIMIVNRKSGIINPGFEQKRYSTAQSISGPIEATKAHFGNPMNDMISFTKVLWDFTRPHTIVGSGISVMALYAFGTPPELWMTSRFLNSLRSCLLPALLMNVYITGLNQITDIEIDKVNKPYLPIAAGQLSKSHGIIVVILSLISSLFLVRNAFWPLQFVVGGSCILGTIYSMPPFRLKRFPLLAALLILTVRGALVNVGFFLLAKMNMTGNIIPSLKVACKMYPESVLLTGFFAVFGTVIAIMKDVPDVQGDKMFNIPSYSVKLGAVKMFRLVGNDD